MILKNILTDRRELTFFTQFDLKISSINQPSISKSLVFNGFYKKFHNISQSIQFLSIQWHHGCRKCFENAALIPHWRGSHGLCWTNLTNRISFNQSHTKHWFSNDFEQNWHKLTQKTTRVLTMKIDSAAKKIGDKIPFGDALRTNDKYGMSTATPMEQWCSSRRREKFTLRLYKHIAYTRYAKHHCNTSDAVDAVNVRTFVHRPRVA